MNANEVIGNLREYLSEYRKTDEIVNYLKKYGLDINSRKWQDIVNEYNSEFAKHMSYVAGNSKGYILTYDKNKIKQANFNKIKKAVSMIRNAKRDLSELGLKSQLTCLDDECSNIENIVDQVELLNVPHETKYEDLKLEGVCWMHG